MTDFSRPEHRPTTRFWRLVVVLICRVFHHMKVRNRPVLPPRGAAILVCNHISGLDPFLLQSALPRLIVWMMAKEYYDLKSLNWFFRIIDAIPVQRSGRDMAAMRQAMRALETGRVLGVFPEGRIATGEDFLPFQTGVALIAIKTGVPVYPAYVDGTTRGKEMVPAMTHRNRVAVRFGPQVVFDRSDTSRETLEKATQAIRSAVGALRQDELKVQSKVSL
jgi:1-acyl-sn-glycerol-3-phosphate acyltransferase